MNKSLVSINKYSEETGWDRRTIKKYVDDSKLKPKEKIGDIDYYNRDELFKSLAAVQKKKAESGTSSTKREQKLDEEIRKLRIANDEKERLVVQKIWIAGKSRDLAERFKSILYSKLVDELPADLSNDVATNRVLLRNVADRLLAEVQSWSKEFQTS